MAVLNDAAPKCAICGQPVEIDVSKTDSNGAAVHKNCYVAKVGARKKQRENPKAHQDTNDSGPRP